MIRFTLKSNSQLAIFPRDDIRQEVRKSHCHGRDVKMVYEQGRIIAMKSFMDDYTYVDVECREGDVTVLVTGPFTVEHIEDTQEEEE